MIQVFTIGYEGTDIDRFIETLKRVDIDILVDVRAVAISRKRGFSKSALKGRLEGEGLLYEHAVELGDPKSGREAARQGRFKEFREIYAFHLASPSARSAIINIAAVAESRRVCLMCFERDPIYCHRSMVARELANSEARVFDLFGDHPSRYDNFPAKLSSYYSSEGISAAE